MVGTTHKHDMASWNLMVSRRRRQTPVFYKHSVVEYILPTLAVLVRRKLTGRGLTTSLRALTIAYASLLDNAMLVPSADGNNNTRRALMEGQNNFSKRIRAEDKSSFLGGYEFTLRHERD